MDKFAISFRDFTAHLVPGVMYLFAYFYIFPESQQVIRGNELFFSFLAIFVAYALGFLADTVFFPRLNKIIRKIPLFKDPMASFFREFKNADISADLELPIPSSVKGLAYSELVTHLGREVVLGSNDTALVYTCIRYVETKNGDAANVLARINSLANLNLCMFPPLVIIAIASFLNGNFVISACCILLSFTTVLKNLDNRKWLARSALRHYFLIRMDEREM